MGASNYIGRVGGLAIALGVGTAVVTGHGVAFADDGGDTGTSSSEGASSAEGANTGPSASTTGTTPGTASTTSTSTATDAKATDTKAADTTDSSPAPTGVVSAQTNTGSSSTGTATDPAPAASPAPTATPEPVTEPTPTASPEPTVEPKPEPAPAADDEDEDEDGGASKAPAPTAAPKPTKAPTAADSGTEAPAALAATPKAKNDTEPTATALAAKVQSTAQIAAAAVTSASVTPATVAVAPAPAAPNPLQVVGKLVSSVVNWVLGPLAGTAPATPAEPPLAWTLLAFARREIDTFVSAVTGALGLSNPAAAAQTTSLAATSLALAQPFALAAAAAVPARPGFPVPGAQISPSTSFVDWVTGNFQPNNTYARYGMWGTDIGTMWDNGIADDPTTPINEHQVLIAFGDTFGGPNMTGTWRLNTLFRSSDLTLADGLAIPDGQWLNGNMFGGSPLWQSNYARQIILPERLPAGLPAGVTLIPTAGISVPTPGTQFGATQYLSFMSVKQWGAAGQWTTNYSAIAYSEDNGENWYVAPQSVRMNDSWSGNANFQQAAFVRPGDGYVYSYGTPNGRQGAAYISRVAERDILDVSKYEYYSKGTAGGWFGIGATKAGWYKAQPAKATAIFGGAEQGACGATKPGSQVSEFSVQYNKTLKKYVAMYGDQSNNIVMRTSDTPQGGWSEAKVLMTQQPGGIYAPMMHPWSPSTMGTGTDLYWNLSLWSEYNVMLMKTDLTKV
ncbi:DUF4185 domain-containing protein [Mycolicibacterium sp. GCM10028919]|uniref:DUF4185 domain-containing protein n=1 Tax=Mycolicibacterium sp. GCM10028919 TaxID=3273401 RepID=UPI00361535C7